MTADDILAVFGADGKLARAIPGFLPRQPQLEMAQAVGHALQSGQSLVVEAGTGTGKTYAYLAPVLLSGQRVVISTGTKNLQDQLFGRDLPRLREVLGKSVKVALLKGRANYLCVHRLEKSAVDVRYRLLWPRFKQLGEWARKSSHGELSEVPGDALDEATTARVTSTTDNCLGAKCPQFSECFVVKARRAAAAADVVVVNHALLFADHVLRQDGFAVLPGADAVIIDEAHQLPELALRHFGQRVSTQQIQALNRDTLTETERWGDTPALNQILTTLNSDLTQFEALFANVPRQRYHEFRQRFTAEEIIHGLGERLCELVECLKPLEERSAEFGGILERALSLTERWQLITEHQKSDEYVRWIEPLGRGGALNATPLHVAKHFGEMRKAHPGAWVFTSATLAVGDNFTHFCQPLGLDEVRTQRLDSPFDYPSQARLWIPPGLPEPQDPNYTGLAAEAMAEVIAASGGGAFVLCTSHRSLQALAGLLRHALPNLLIVAQGDASKAQLLEQFVASGNAVLVATASFWEGVDVKGPALRVVIIDKLPFSAPGDPVLDAKQDAIRQAGGNPFNEDQLPRAIVTLRQGVGRLIRDVSDRGLLMLCDPRLKTKAYGKKVLASLPDIPVIQTKAEALAWCAQLKAGLGQNS